MEYFLKKDYLTVISFIVWFRMIANYNHKSETRIIGKIRFLSLFFLVSLFFLHAETFTYDHALAECDKLDLHPQIPESDGRTHTLNKKGAVTAVFDYAIQAFIEFSAWKEVLEIGGTYGDVMLAALKQNKETKYTLNDIEPRHLFIAAKKLQKKIQNKELSEDSIKQVNFLQGDITKTEYFKDMGHYDAILVGRVLHFLNPKEMKIAIQNIYNLLKPGGRVFVVAITPYVKRYEKFIPIYKKRVEDGIENPGYVESLLEYVNSDVTTPEQIKNISPEPFFFLDDNVLEKFFESQGFKVIECKMMPLAYNAGKSISWTLDGRENVILIAEKPIDQKQNDADKNLVDLCNTFFAFLKDKFQNLFK